ncbi:hypothetical protein DCO58_07565 [Helicobacter saguini]|uniref:Lipoprotein n=1 Tax=Helicobacter saguini TaxID=1548018 RepID=A0A347VND5_9HELI|nr:hypothetical protein [Helicobacter saguini]MWV61810.1 hypothetical protein [Helicobacter saguini]MWV67515.1 hypothetical protein [Helicobacter saguini]MWV69866.1 hypothetical protein [Helicobacter saguini]MWV72916.1 hypothetical protein [Helicobacter saguini]TLD93268.1 hypothetical protein LS64_009145 [Helicobacter saguini]
MKKVFLVVVSFALLVGFNACGNKTPKNSKLKKNEFISTKCDMVCSKDECNQVCTTITGTLK